MRTKVDSWLSISLFVAKSNWSLVIKNAIIPLVEQLTDNDDLHSFKLAFNSNSGENIRLSLLVPEERKHAVSEAVDRHIKRFFANNNLPATNVNQYNGLFMPFPVNTVQYGLFHAFTDLEHPHVEELEVVLSKMMTETFADDAIDDELILTFILYVLFNCYKVIKNSCPDLATKWQQYYQEVTNALKTEDFNDKLIKEQYELMEKAIDEIYFDTMHPANSNDLPWLMEWENSFDKVFSKFRNNENNLLFFCRVHLLINRQLDLDNNSQLLISAFFNETVIKQNLIKTKNNFAF